MNTIVSLDNNEMNMVFGGLDDAKSNENGFNCLVRVQQQPTSTGACCVPSAILGKAKDFVFFVAKSATFAVIFCAVFTVFNSKYYPIRVK
jgi:hypothetical protein